MSSYAFEKTQLAARNALHAGLERAAGSVPAELRPQVIVARGSAAEEILSAPAA
ncbi:MAG TPA: hypothetical protein VIM22_01070 [Solirubrobacteraceae bacterium]